MSISVSPSLERGPIVWIKVGLGRGAVFYSLYVIFRHPEVSSNLGVRTGTLLAPKHSSHPKEEVLTLGV